MEKSGEKRKKNNTLVLREEKKRSEYRAFRVTVERHGDEIPISAKI